MEMRDRHDVERMPEATQNDAPSPKRKVDSSKPLSQESQSRGARMSYNGWSSCNGSSVCGPCRGLLAEGIRGPRLDLASPIYLEFNGYTVLLMSNSIEHLPPSVLRE
jgi:hypothetical protein